MIVIELFEEVGHEIAAEPVTFAIEVVQFLILVGIVYVVGWGFGKRRGFVRNMLTEHRDRIARDLSQAEGAEGDLAVAREQATASVQAAEQTATREIAAARERADATLAAAKADTDREADGMREHARELLVIERDEMLAHSRERLLDVVGRATRYILSEGLSPAEQRSLIQRSIMEGLSGDGDHSAQGAGAEGAEATSEPRGAHAARGGKAGAAA